jgi:hypothetical protein
MIGIIGFTIFFDPLKDFAVFYGQQVLKVWEKVKLKVE